MNTKHMFWKKNILDAYDNLFESHEVLSELRQEFGYTLFPWYLLFWTDDFRN